MKWFVFIQFNHCNRLPLDEKVARLPDEKEWKYSRFFCVSYSSGRAFTDQNWIPKTAYCIRCVMVCRIGFTNWNTKIAFLCACMVVTYYIKLFGTGADRHNGILMHLLLVAEAITARSCFTRSKIITKINGLH